MGRTIVTGDKHMPSEYKLLSFANFPRGHELTREDYVIILGDFGVVWDNSKEENWWLDWFNDRPWTTLFIDGNHQNFPLLYSYPVEEWNSGKTHVLRPNIRHLMRGQVFTLNEKKIFTMGGAYSIDKSSRREGVSWWPEELPCEEELDEGWRNLKKNDFKVDYIFTHTVPSFIARQMAMFIEDENSLDNFLTSISRAVEFTSWWAGHWHQDRSFKDGKYNIVYHDIIELFDFGNFDVIN